MYMKKNIQPSIKKCQEDAFLHHLSQFIGQTVTVYTVSASGAGQGFTGILLTVTPFMISLVTSVGPAPAYPLTGHPPCPQPGSVDNIGSITDIPIDKITAFVRNAVS